jgi:hypothetical protein
MVSLGRAAAAKNRLGLIEIASIFRLSNLGLEHQGKVDGETGFVIIEDHHSL